MIRVKIIALVCVPFLLKSRIVDREDLPPTVKEQWGEDQTLSGARAACCTSMT